LKISIQIQVSNENWDRCDAPNCAFNNTFFNGEISEILVYNRVLSANEAASVESYLRNKFGTR